MVPQRRAVDTKHLIIEVTTCSCVGPEVRKDKIYFLKNDKEQIGEIVHARLAMSWPHTGRKSQGMVIMHTVEKSDNLYGREWR